MTEKSPLVSAFSDLILLFIVIITVLGSWTPFPFAFCFCSLSHLIPNLLQIPTEPFDVLIKDILSCPFVYDAGPLL